MIKTHYIFASFAITLVLAFNSTGEPHNDDDRTTPINEEVMAPLPNHWKVRFLNEPIFSSRIRVIETGKLSNPVIILVHGLGQSGLRDWDNVIPVLEQKYHVIALDLPGFGESDVPEGRYSPLNYAKLLHWLKLQYSDQPVHIVGHSMGAAIVLRYGHLFPQDLKKVVLIDAAGILERTAFVKHSARVAADRETLPGPFSHWVERAKDFGASVIEKVSSGPDPSKILQESDLLWNALMSNRPNMNAAMSLVEEDFSASVYNFPHPTTIIWGEKDNVAPIRTGEMLARQLDQVEHFFVIKGAGHVAMKSHPDQFNQKLMQGLSATPKTHQALENAFASIDRTNVSCQRNSKQYFEGEYDTLEIDHCNEVVLNYVTAKRLIIRSSTVSINNTYIKHSTTALDAKESVVVATNVTFDGNIRSEGSRLDFAGVTVRSTNKAVLVGKPSRLIFSISQLESATYKGYAHGDYKIEQSSLDDALLKIL